MTQGTAPKSACRRLVRAASVGVVATLCGIFAKPAIAGLTITTTFDSSLDTQLTPATKANWVNAWNYAVTQYQNQFSDNININITLAAGGGLGGSNTQLQFIGPTVGTAGYASMKTILLADSKTANDVSAYSHLPVADPTGGRLFIVSNANAKALGVFTGSSSASDGTITLGATQPYTYDPNNRAVAGAFDFIGVAEHEISEVMGRIGILGQTLNTGFALDDPIDLFGFSSAGNLNLNQNQSGVYFSIDGGTTSLRVYNNHSNGGDDKDWADGINGPGAVAQGPDSYNAFGNTGIKEDISTVDLQSMDVIGYDLIPEPTSLSILGLCSAGLLARRRKRV